MELTSKKAKVEFLTGMLATVLPEEGDIHMSRRGDVITVEVGGESAVGSVRDVKAQIVRDLEGLGFGDAVASLDVGGVKATLTKKEIRELVVTGGE